MNFNPFQFISLLRNKGNPQQMVYQMLQQQAKGNPMMMNLLALAQRGNSQEIEQFARNYCKERGTDFDSAFQKFKKDYGL